MEEVKEFKGQNVIPFEEGRKTILVVDDEKPIRDILIYNLKKEGYETVEAEDGEKAISLALEKKPDLILLDIMLPKVDGLTVCKRLRLNLSVPILILSAKDEEIDKILGLELGANDYITKPFSVRELMARVRVRGNVIDLTLREFEVLKYLANQPGQVVTRETLLEKVWGYEYYGDIRTVDVTVRRIREKVEKDTSAPKILITKRGVGYYLAAE